MSFAERLDASALGADVVGSRLHRGAATHHKIVRDRIRSSPRSVIRD